MGRVEEASSDRGLINVQLSQLPSFPSTNSRKLVILSYGGRGRICHLLSVIYCGKSFLRHKATVSHLASAAVFSIPIFFKLLPLLA